MKTDAKWFYDKFFNAVTEDKYYNVYRFNAPQFTCKVNLEIRRIIEGAGLTSQKEYYRIDVVGWNSIYKDIEERASRLGLNAHLWNLEVAVEHENSKMDWTDELVKIAHIRCPLKVIICYNYSDGRDDDSDFSDKKKLCFAYDCLSRMKYYDPKAKEELLIIIGNASPKKKESSYYSNFDYRGYVLRSGCEAFVKL